MILTVNAQFQHITFTPVAEESLSSAFVRCIYKDARGFMWFGLGNGLIRYDGINVNRYEHNPGDRNSIPNNRINAIVEDANHNLYIGTAQGLVRYDPEKDNFINVDSISNNTNHLVNKYVTALCFDLDGKMWIGTHGHGLHIYNPKTFTFSYLEEANLKTQVSPSNYITSLFRVNDVVWVGTKGGLKLFHTKDIQPMALPVDDKSVTSTEIKDVIQDRAGNIWLGTADRMIIKLTPHNEKYTLSTTVLKQNVYGEGSDNILTLCLDANGNLWIGGENSGLNYFDTKSNTITHYAAEEGNPKRLPTNSIRYVYLDNTGITWVGTHNKGAFFIDNHAKKFDSYQQNLITKSGLSGNNIKGLAEDKEGNIWIASDGGGIGKLDAKTQELESYEDITKKMGTRYLSALLYDNAENLWIGTWGRGVYRLNLKTHELKNYKLESHGFGDNKVFSLYQDKRGSVWVGTVGSGLFYKDMKSDQFTLLDDQRKKDHISRTAYISSILEDVDNRLWVGTLFGLYQLTPNSDYSYNYKWHSNDNLTGSIGSNEIQTIYEDTEKSLWFGTNDNGLNLLARGSSVFKVIRKQDGLPSNAVRGILSDEKGNLWISGNNGLTKYSPTTNSFLNYTKEDGLPSNEYNFNTYLRSKEGKFYFGSDNGLVVFYPDSIQSNPIKPIVYLTDLKLNNQSVQIGTEDSPLQKHISLTRSIDLTYNQRSFVIDFASVNYGQSSRNQYCYKLEGFDENWNCIGTRHSATYTNIDPGDYVFLVRAANSDGISSDAPSRLDITIHTAPWKTGWAILFYIVALTSFVIFLVRIRLERIKIKNQLEFERLAHEQEHALNESKTQFFTNISHELRTPLSLIFMPLENLLSTDSLPSTVKERLSTIHNNADKMMRLVNELMDFNKLESSKLRLRVQQGELVKFITDRAAIFIDLAEKRNIHLGIHSMVRSLDGWFDHDKLEKILVNVLSNAFKFTLDDGQINVTINTKDLDLVNEKGKYRTRSLELVIVDNGMGISEEELPYIFEKFYQAKSSTKIANPGTGIGLSLTKGLIELHHGKITVESTPEHETKFVILLPIDRQAYNDDDIYEVPGYILTPDTVSHDEPDGLHRTEWAEEADQDKSQILVVEDNDELRKYITLELRQHFNVLEAKNGAEGLEMAFEKSPDLIVSDVLMPIKSGIELCVEIKSNLKTSHIPVILLTAKTTVDDQVNGLASGADVYITKPFSIRFLLAQVNQIITSRQKLYSRFSQDVYLLPGKVASNEIDQAFLQKAIDYIIENIQDPQLGVDSIANLFSLSRVQVYRKVKALTGKSVVDFIRMVRIKQALKLMELQKYTLSEIAFQAGFNSSSYFTRCFKDQYGKAPSEYLENK
ncbi:MAG TPA: two-component regulator propeller domain-containing protein [Chryseolinea sp.]|nr:two-component regulator propeller domain-containing protein [Chryseolinea sp.]